MSIVFNLISSNYESVRSKCASEDMEFLESVKDLTLRQLVDKHRELMIELNRAQRQKMALLRQRYNLPPLK